MLTKVTTFDIHALKQALERRFDVISQDEHVRLWRVIEGFLNCFPSEVNVQVTGWQFDEGFIDRTEVRLKELVKEENYFSIYIRFVRTRSATIVFTAPGSRLIEVRDRLLSQVKRASATLSPVLSGEITSVSSMTNKLLIEQVDALHAHHALISNLPLERAALLALWVLRSRGAGRYKAAIAKKSVFEAILLARFENLATEEDIERALEVMRDQKLVNVVENATGTDVVNLLKLGRDTAEAYFGQLSKP